MSQQAEHKWAVGEWVMITHSLKDMCIVGRIRKLGGRYGGIVIDTYYRYDPTGQDGPSSFPGQWPTGEGSELHIELIAPPEDAR